MQERKTDSCAKCGRSVKSDGSGSLTQWISACRCNDLGFDLGRGEDKIEICSTCAKRVSRGRAGSFTQWILRSDICNCATPAATSFIAADGERQSTPVARSDESELHVEAENFPYDRFKPLAEIGRGASGLVYQCRDRILGKRVAIKVLRTVTTVQLISFQKEARALSQLNHPGIVSVLDFGVTASSAPYMVLEFINGVTLSAIIDERGAMPLDVAIPIFSRIAEALTYTHSKGVYHRDLKSSNIVLVEPELGAELEVRIIDFGVAAIKNATQEPTIFQGNSIVGTPAYMSADQTLGLPYDARSEIYSLGCVLFEALTGQVPFEGDTVLTTIRMHAQDVPPRLSEMREDLEFSEAIESLVARCLEKSPESRFQSMEEFQEALLKILDEDVSDVTVTKRKSEKPWRVVKDCILACLVIGVLGAVFFVAKNHFEAESTREEKARRAKFEAQGLRNAIYELPNVFLHNPDAGSYYANGTVTDDHLVALLRAKRGQIRELDLAKADQQFEKKTISARGWKAIGKMDLKVLKLYSTQIQNEDLKEIARLKNLEQLDLTCTEITDEGIAHLTGLPKLETLNLTKTKITDKATESIAEMKSVTSPIMSDTSITNAGVANLVRLPNYHNVNLAGTFIDDGALKYIAGIPHPDKIILERTKVTGRGLMQLGHLKEFVSLNVNNVEGIDDEVLAYIVKTWPQLQVLELGDCNLPPQSIKRLFGLKRLWKINLCSSQLTDADVEPVLSLPNIKVWVLATNDLTDKTVERLCQRETIDFIDLNHCPLTAKGLRMLDQRKVTYTALPPMGKGRIDGIQGF